MVTRFMSAFGTMCAAGCGAWLHQAVSQGKAFDIMWATFLICVCIASSFILAQDD